MADAVLRAAAVVVVVSLLCACGLPGVW